MASQGYYNQGPQYPQQRCAVSLSSAMFVQGVYLQIAPKGQAQGMRRRNILTDLSSHPATAVATLSKAILPSNMVDTTKVLL